jgi:two-component system sensor histidine kinase EvgS
MEGLASLYRLNREGTLAALREADEQLRLMRMADSMVSGVLVIGITATWWIVIRLVRRQREQLNQYVSRVETANADLNAFAGRTAHDLRNILNPLLLAVGALKLAHGDGATVATLSQRIERATGRGLALLDALLDFSRAGQVSGRDEVCSMRAERLAVVEELAPMAERVGAKVEVVMEASTNPKVKCSAGLCGILVRNVVGNAVKFSDCSPKRQVRVSVRTIENEWCDIAVEDTGPSIPSEAIPHIFEPFYRAPGAGAPGTGIGLATVQRIVHAHGGRIAVHSKLGEGTRFDLRLPLASV